MPRLTDPEKADVLRHLEQDKPLPDKYRFLLFDDKREVELVWNGKTNDVCIPLFGVTEGRAYSGAEYREVLAAAGLEPGGVVPTLVHCGVLPGSKHRTK
jgi:hypothetical protein